MIRREFPALRQILIVDDGNPDGTAAVAREIPGVIVLARTRSRGYGHSMRDGLRMALAGGADAVISMDAVFIARCDDSAEAAGGFGTG